MKLHCIFNQKSKKFIGFSLDDRILKGKILHRTVEFDKGVTPNLGNLGWEGDYETGTLVNLTDQKAKVTESDLEEKMYNRFFRKFSVERSIFAILYQLEEWRHQKALPLEDQQPEFKDMMDFFVAVVKRYIDEIEHFKNSDDHVFVDKIEAKQDLKDRFQA